MYSILLVDDEKLELETLRDYINWKGLGIDTIYTARNGERALDVVMEHNPDIIITDVQMPKMDGVQFARQLREEGYDTKLVFLTGYDDFEYARAALKVNAVDYILKPFTVSGIEEVIGSIKEKMEWEREVKRSMELSQSNILSRICQGSEDVEGLYSKLLKLWPDGPKSYGLIGVYGNLNKQESDHILSHFKEFAHAMVWGELTIYLIMPHVHIIDAARRIDSYLTQNNDLLRHVFYREGAALIVHLRDACQEFVQKQLAMFYYLGEPMQPIGSLPVLVQEKEDEPGELSEIRGEIRKAVATGNKELAGQHLNSYFQALTGQEKKHTDFYCRELYHYLHEELVVGKSYLEQLANEREKNVEVELSRAGCFRDITGILADYTGFLTDSFQEQKNNPNKNVAAYVQEYIHNHYMDVVNVEDIAMELSLSVNYVRNIYKEQTGKTILEYTTEYRLNQACSFLKDKKLKIKEVSAMVGYENHSYFCSAFSKRFGVTPKDYRKNI